MRLASWTVTRSLRVPTVSPVPLPSSPFVCRTCRAARRFYSSPAAPPPLSEPAAPPPPPSGYAALGSRRLISVSGPDAAKYLQGVITSNIHAPNNKPRRAGFYSAFLNAQGRVLHDVFIYPDTLTDKGASSEAGTSFLIEVDAAEVDRLARHIRRYKLRAEFDLRTLAADEATVWHVWDDAGRPLRPDGSSGEDGGRRPQPGPPQVLDTRSPTHGSRLVSPGGAGHQGLLQSAAPWLAELGLDRASEASYRVRRYLHGVAEGQAEILHEAALPPESNMDLAGAIDWHKGCYVGQELTIRTRHRGVVRKRILPCALYAEDGAPAPERLEYHPDAGTALIIPPGTSIGRVGKRGRSAGKWLAGVGNLGLALCRLEIMTDVALPGEVAEAAVHEPGNEFVMVTELDESGGSGRAVKVKAFVPDWLRAGLAVVQAGEQTRA